MAPGVLEQLIAEMEAEALSIGAELEAAESEREARCLERCRQLAVSCGTVLHMQLATRDRLDRLAASVARLEAKNG